MNSDKKQKIAGRLFLKLVATVDVNARKENYGLEPLPDIDFNIRAGNTLIGFATEKELLETIEKKEGLFAQDKLDEFKEEFAELSQLYQRFQNAQLITDQGSDSFKAAKAELNKRLNTLNHKLNVYLATNYGIDAELNPEKFKQWLTTHQPFHWFAEFYQIVAGNEGFDVIIGNPPYVEYSSNTFSYKIVDIQFTGKTNLYAVVLDRCRKINSFKGKLGMIVLLSLTSTKRMVGLVKRLIDEYEQLYFSHYEGTTNPSTLFEGVKAQLNITLCSRKGNKSCFSTHYFRAYAEERPILFEKLAYQAVENNNHVLIPKVSCRMPINLSNELIKQNTNYRLGGGHKLYYRNMGNFFWKLAFNEEPLYKKNGRQVSSSTVSLISFSNKNECDSYISFVNSSLFFLYWNTYSDCYHLSKNEILQYIPNDLLSSEETETVVNSLLESYDENGYIQTENARNGDVKEYYRYFPQKSKPIIDQIDTVLAQHYGFTEEELDFIINYDIKYRMGKELENV